MFFLAVAIGMGAAAFGCGLGQGRVASAACEGMARNPGAAGAIRAAMILGLVPLVLKGLPRPGTPLQGLFVSPIL